MSDNSVDRSLQVLLGKILFYLIRWLYVHINCQTPDTPRIHMREQ